MPGAVRLGDACTGHGAFPSRPNVAASGNVFINGKGAHRAGDAWDTHCSPASCHGGAQAGGSPNVFVNGKPLARIGDPVDCGSSCAAGSPNVIING
ncbi:PAAR motif protein [compost metagenome]